MSFLAGIVVGALGTYAFLVFSCQRAVERFREVVKEEIDRA